MYRLLSLVSFCLVSGFIVGQGDPVLVWQKSLGGTSIDRAAAVTRTSDNHIVVVGSTESADIDVAGAHGGSDIWLVKLASSGSLVWQKCLGGSFDDYGNDVVATADSGTVVIGVARSTDGDITSNLGNEDLWVAKLDKQGAIEWERSYGGSDKDRGFSVITTIDGGYVLLGQTKSNDIDVSFNNGNYDVWVCKIDALGSIEWEHALGGSNGDEGSEIIQTADSGYLVVGNTLSNNGDVSGNNGGYDAWVIKLTPQGNLQWQHALGGSSTDRAYAVIETSDGYIIAGHSFSNNGDVSGNHGNTDAWAFKLDYSGGLIWQRALGGAYSDWASSVIKTPSGFLILGGTDSVDGQVSGNHGSMDYWLVELDSVGNILWQNPLGGSEDDEGYDIAVLADGTYILVGGSRSQDGDVNEPRGSEDFWFVNISFNYAVVSGFIFNDLNSNGTLNIGEPAIANWPVQDVAGRTNFSLANGVYSTVVIDTGIFSWGPAAIPYYASVPTQHISTFSMLVQQVDSLNDFAIQPTGAFNDLCINISPVGFYRPGFPCQYVIDYTNVGTSTLSPDVVLLPDPWLTFDSASLAPTSTAPDSVVWQLPPLAPFQTGQITAHLTLDANAGLGTVLNSTARIEQLIGDANVGNNMETWDVVTQGSYDPNDILVDRSSVDPAELTPTPPDLNYIIRFQNTGTDTAFTVRIENDFPENADLSTFRFVASSDPVQINYLQHVDRFEFRFDNILLPDSNVNEPESHGFIRYTIKPKSTLLLGDSVLNTAGIYFDFNAPIITNTAFTVIENTTGIDETTDIGFTVTPNPSDGLISVLLREPIDGTLVVSNVSGREVARQFINGQMLLLDLSDQPKGVYFMTLDNGDRSISTKLVLK